MSQLSVMINNLNPVLKANQTSAERIESIIIQHSIGAAATGLAAGVMPGVGGVIASLTSAGVIWSMYYRICRELNITLSKNILKALGSAVLSNLVTQLGGVLAIELAATLVPGLSVVASAAVCYGVTYLAGYLFISLLAKVFHGGRNPDDMDEQELAAMLKAVSVETNCKSIFKAAKEDAKRRIRNGEITKADAM